MPQRIYSESLLDETRELLLAYYPKHDGKIDPDFFEMSMDIGYSMRTIMNYRDGISKKPNAELVQLIYERLSGNRLLTSDVA